MKSLEMLGHIVVGIGKGCKDPKGFTISPLLTWTMSHCTTKV
jgi:hypothetical protein